MSYKTIPIRELELRKTLLNKFNISFKTYPLSVNQQKALLEDHIKIEYKFNSLHEQLMFSKDLRLLKGE